MEFLFAILIVVLVLAFFRQIVGALIVIGVSVFVVLCFIGAGFALAGAFVLDLIDNIRRK